MLFMDDGCMYLPATVQILPAAKFEQSNHAASADDPAWITVDSCHIIS
jgi:hypothetical protein